MNVRFITLVIAICFGLWSCNSSQRGIKIEVENNLDIDRYAETVEIDKLALGLAEGYEFTNLSVLDAKSGKVIPSQWIDKDGDDQADVLIFQPDIMAKSKKYFFLKIVKQSDSLPLQVYSRFVPERTDDYTWENDKVAFRTYGPLAQKMVEDGVEGGTLSSGIDCWLKRVDYPIINRWYEKYTNGTGTYHEDTGEGLDNYHVGNSRGCGGLGVWTNDELAVSKNFIGYKTLGEGPIRTSFILDYANWTANDKTISEKKFISLDLGMQLMKVEAQITGVDTITIALTLHENNGTTNIDTTNGWFRYWQPLDDSELGTALVINPTDFVGFKKVESEEPDKSQLYVHIKVVDNKASYYTGFGWKKARQITTPEKWDEYLASFATKLANPLSVTIIK